MQEEITKIWDITGMKLPVFIQCDLNGYKHIYELNRSEFLSGLIFTLIQVEAIMDANE